MEFASGYVYVGPNDEEEVVEVDEQHSSLATNFHEQNVDDGETCMVDILDTAGQEEFSALRDQYMRNSDGFLIVYSIDDLNSLEVAKTIYNWTKAVREDQTTPAVLCGNKMDLEDTRKVTTEWGLKTAEKLGVDFIETSAKTGCKVTAAFEALVRKIPRKGISYKIAVLGAGGVGKSAITIRYVNNTFVDSYDPTIEDSYRKRVTVAGLRPPAKHHAEKKRGSGFFSSLKRRLSGKKRSALKTDKRARPTFANVLKENVPKADTNFILVSLGKLSQTPQLVTGDPVYCKNCPAVLSKQDVDTENLSTVNGKTNWMCEFCNNNNTELSLAEGEVPEGPWFDFMLSPAPDPGCLDQAEPKQGLVVFCIDISSSMDTQAQIPKSQAMWRKMRDGKTPDDGETWSKTRLECIKEAVQRQLESLQVEHPQKKVALVTFGTDVYVHGDGTQDPVCVFGEMGYQDLLDKGREIYNEIRLRSLSDSLRDLSSKVAGLTTSGCTALGPALTVSIGMTSQLPASEIILCTDGAPNIGVGHNVQNTVNFYAKVGKVAFTNKTVVSLLAVEGEPVGLKYVGEVAAVTKGTINIVSPLEIVRQIRNISQNPVVATAVDVRVLLHPSLVFDEVDSAQGKSMTVQEVGTACQDTDLTFRYVLKDKDKLGTHHSLPFQVQITYTLLDGMKCLRVITKHLEVTTERDRSEKSVNVAVLGLAAVQRSANLAEHGSPRGARRFLHAVERMMRRGATTSIQQEEHFSFVSESEAVDRQLRDLSLSKGLSATEEDEMCALNYRSKLSANLWQFQGSSNKSQVVSQRQNFDENLRDMYYGYQC